MAEPTDDVTEWQSEGWAVRQRIGIAAAVTTPLLLLLALLFFGNWYGSTLRPLTVEHVTPFPRPGVVLERVTATRDPNQPAPRATPDAAIQDAKRSVAAEGITGWPGRRQ